MGFLNNTTITIDAILTKRGRELLARGRNEFKVTKFALADDEVDYRLWDTSHPNGTNFYGAVIENMPILEPVPDETQVLKYKLVTLPKETSRLPILDVSISSLNFTSGLASAEIVAPGTLNSTDRSIIFLEVSLAITSKWYVSPLMTHPKEINPLKLSIFFFIK